MWLSPKHSVEIFEQEAILIIHDHEDAVRPIANALPKELKYLRHWDASGSTQKLNKNFMTS